MALPIHNLSTEEERTQYFFHGSQSVVEDSSTSPSICCLGPLPSVTTAPLAGRNRPRSLIPSITLELTLAQTGASGCNRPQPKEIAVRKKFACVFLLASPLPPVLN